MKTLIDYVELIDPTIFIVLGGLALKMVGPYLRAKHLDQKATNIMNAAKVAVTYSAKQTGLDNDQKRELAEKQLTQWASDHGVKLNQDRMAATIEYAYQHLKNGSLIDIKEQTPASQNDQDNLPNIDPKFKFQIQQKQGGNN
ncbi:phage holin family protein (plasmid) [Fructilactobacillus ixorae]|uniref:Phage holin family protein n=1 Tax=Fructilactobacillus ixorae TaxID=1750535 RepID=A0ABY5C7D9_9LACO|nr:phage holin, LLH family [Fructilactobacillus ixorae]USS94020.1 phage holin family protein [Fructilactobacillus ixorae]